MPLIRQPNYQFRIDWSFVSTASVDNNQGGNFQLYSLPVDTRYAHISKSDLQNGGFLRAYSSATVYRSFRGEATMIFLDNFYTLVKLSSGQVWAYWGGPDYSGKFLQLTNVLNERAFTVDRFSDSAFDNQAASIILVDAGHTSLRFSFRDLFLNEWKTSIDKKLAGTTATRNGDPILTWEMWPVGYNELNPGLCYLKISQLLNVELDWWPDYKASMTYHIYLFVDGQGNLQGSVARWGVWVEDGIFHDSIKDDLQPKVISGVDTINQKLANELAKYSGITFKDLWYLPGRQVRYPTGNVMTGTTTDDVTIVVTVM